MSTFTIQSAAPLHLQIADHLEGRITAGELHAGERLPNTVELAAEYGVTPVTIQKSLQRLVGLDLLERVPRRGTFVKAHQTANTIGLVFGYSPFQDPSAVYLRMLELFRCRAVEEEINLKIYFDIQSGSNSRSFFELRRDVAAGSLKALIALDRSPALSDWLERQQEIFWIEPRGTDIEQTVRLGTEYLLERGYRRIMVVSMYGPVIPYDDWAEAHRREQAGFEAAITGRQVQAELVRWGQTEVDGYRVGKEIFSAPPGQRPEAIFVNHDVVTRGLLLALMELGLKIPDDVALLSHANRGCEFASPVVLSQILIDPLEMVDNCLRLLRRTEYIPGRRAMPERVKARLIPGKSCGE